MIEAVQAKAIVSVFHQRCVGEFEGQYSMLFQNVLDFKVNTTNITGGLSFPTPPWQHSLARCRWWPWWARNCSPKRPRPVSSESECAVFVVWVFASSANYAMEQGAVCQCACHCVHCRGDELLPGAGRCMSASNFRQWNEEFHHLTSTKTPKCHKANPVTKVRRDIMSTRDSPRNMWDLGAHYLVANSCICEA